MVWTDEQKAFAVRSYLKTGSLESARLEFQRKYNLHKRYAPTNMTIYRWAKAFDTCGSVKKNACVQNKTDAEVKPGNSRRALSSDPVFR